MIGDYKTVSMETSLKCGNAIRQILRHSKDVWAWRYKSDNQAPPCASRRQMCEAECFIFGDLQNCFTGEYLGVLDTPPRCFRVRRFRLSRKRRRCLEPASAVARMGFQNIAWAIPL
ncbi:UNVERIFIED_CONTAM: hypothetical protein Sangu_2757700 [Sesamum angustifolium]|uniref:Uncharacterized protein n=1 Tax=Sesamum angustifolium TaxID=2727405 RepID=A0AAW2IWU1_9LAMI